MNFKVYYINLEKSLKRNVFMQSQINEIGLPVTRIPAINGYTLSKETLASISRQTIFSHFIKPMLGEVGAFLSHKKSWELISNQSEDFAIIFEDDVRIDRQLFSDLPIILKNITTNDIVDISGRLGFLKQFSIAIANSLFLYKFSTPPLGMTGKIIGKKAAQELYRKFPYYLAPVDVMLQKVYQHKINIYTINKKYLSHEDSSVGGSTIQNKTVNIVYKVIRETKRPFWRLAIKIRNFFSDQSSLKEKVIYNNPN